MKLLILDKDGTLVRPVSGEKFVQHPHDQELIPDVAEALARYAADGWAMAIASNQGGVAAGHKTLDDAIAEMRFCLRLLVNAGYDSKDMIAYFCPDAGDVCGIVKGATDYFPYRERDHHLKVSSYRKPSPGMIEAAIMEHKPMFSDFESVLFVGDRPEDKQAAANAGVQFMWASDWRG